jgi:tetratricopeptide (TPR) repeat protein/GTPase SAR1 family protein
MKSIFISSTFKDMQAERDALALYVLPEISQLAAAHFESVDFIDLRWGVDTSELESEDGAKKVLSVCLDEIDRSNPYMIVLLGERYGWVPERELLLGAVQSKGYPLSEDYKSVTALEIEYGALSEKGRLDCCLFYERKRLNTDAMPAERASNYTPESERHKEKLAALKEKIEARIGQPIKSYTLEYDPENDRMTGLDEFCEMVLSDLCTLLEKQWCEDNRTWQERSMLSSWLYLDNKAVHFSALYDLCDMMKQRLSDDNTRILILKGESGSGKSTIIAKLACDYRDDGYDVFPFVCGENDRSGTTVDLLQQLCFFLSKKLELSSGESDQDPVTFSDCRREFIQLCSVYSERFPDRKLIIVLDGLELLQGVGVLGFDWMPDVIPENICVLSCCTSDFPVRPPLRMQKNTVTVQNDELSDGAKAEIINSILSANHKQLNPDLASEIIKHKSSSSPLFLSLLMQRLIMLDSKDFAQIEKLGNDMSAINDYLLDVVSNTPDSLEELCRNIVLEAGERIDVKMASYVLKLIAKTRRGLREKDISDIFAREQIPFSALNFSRLMKYLRPYFIMRGDGRIDFSHKIIRSAIMGNMEDKERGNLNRMLFKSIEKLPVDDPVAADELVLLSFLNLRFDTMIAYVTSIDFAKMQNAPRGAMQLFAELVMGSSKYFWGFLEKIEDYSDGEKFLHTVCSKIGNFISTSAKGQEKLQQFYATVIPQIERYSERGMLNKRDAVRTKVKLGDSYIATGKLQEAEKLYISSIEELYSGGAVEEENAPLGAQALRALSMLYMQMGDYKKMLENAEKAEKLQSVSNKRSQMTNLAASKELLAEAYVENKDYEAAFVKMFEAIELRKEILSDEDSPNAKRNLAIAYDHAANIYIHSGDNLKRYEYCKMAYALREQAASEIRLFSMQRELALSLNNMSLAEIYLGYCDKANSNLDQAYDIFNYLYETLRTAQSYEDMSEYWRIRALCHIMQNDDTGALAAAQKAKNFLLELSEKTDSSKIRSKIEHIDSLITEKIGNAEFKKAISELPQTNMKMANAKQNSSEIAFAYAQKLVKTDIAEAKKHYAQGLETLEEIAKQEPTDENLDHLARWYNQAAIDLKGYREIQDAYWSRSVEIWTGLYENAKDKATKKKYKKTYLYSKVIKKTLLNK